MFLKQSKSHNKIYLSFVQGYRDESGKIKHKTIKKLGFLDDLKKEYEDPISHFKKIVNVNMELDKNVNLEIGQFVPILFH